MLSFKVKVVTVLILAVIPLLFTVGYVKSQSFYDVTGTNFYLYFGSDTTFVFQHPYVPMRYSGINATINVDSGVLNGTTGRLTMNDGGGVLRFISQDNASFSSPTPQVRTYVNNVEISRLNVTITNGDSVRIVWQSLVWSPIGLILGLIGLALFIVTPVYTVYEVKQNKNYIWLVYCLALLSLAYAFTTSWFQ